MRGKEPEDAPEGAVAIPLTGELDLHPFAPRDIPSVVEEYVHACHGKGVRHLRLAHLKGLVERVAEKVAMRRSAASSGRT